MARILVVDDDHDICEVLEMGLTHAGHEVRVAADGASALRLVRAQPLHLIITDIFMPGKEGIETIMEIRRDFPAVKVVAVSGGGREGGPPSRRRARAPRGGPTPRHALR